MPSHITQLHASLGRSNYFVIIVKSYRGYSDVCMYLEKTFKTLTVIRIQVLQHKNCSVDAPNFDPRGCENQQKINFFYAAFLNHFPTKIFNSETTSF